jgi:hypothetical protein
MIYIVKPLELPFAKIGRANNPRNRLSSLQSGNPFKMCVLGLFLEDNELNEERLHSKFSGMRYFGEWFYFTDVLRDFLSDTRNLMLLLDKLEFKKVEYAFTRGVKIMPPNIKPPFKGWSTFMGAVTWNEHTKHAEELEKHKTINPELKSPEEEFFDVLEHLLPQKKVGKLLKHKELWLKEA